MTKVIAFLILGCFCLTGSGSPIAWAQQGKKPAAPTLASARPFKVADDIGLARFPTLDNHGSVIEYSPDGRYFFVLTQEGLLDLNVAQNTIWLFRTDNVRKHLQQPDAGAAPLPLPLVRITDKEGPTIGNVTWLPDSTGIAFTAVKRNERCKFNQLYLADIRTGAVQPLTPEDQNVEEFDIRSRNAFVYAVSSPKLLTAPGEEVTVLTGKLIYKALFPEHPAFMRDLAPFDEAGLWVALDGKRSRVLDAQAYPAFSGSSLSLSPDGSSAVAILRTDHPPQNWARYKSSPVYPDHQLDPIAYYLIDLKKGTKKLLFNAPCGLGHYWWIRVPEIARWSADGRSLLLSNTFLPLDVSDPKERAERENHPNMAVLRLDTGRLSAVLPVIARYDKRRYAINDARFIDDHTVFVNYDRSWIDPDGAPSAILHENSDGTWMQVPSAEDPRLASLSIKVEARETISQPPQIVAAVRVGGNFHVIWDPNPQLKEIDLGEAEVIHGTDANGFEWEAGLVKPVNYEPGKRYPLVIQTHGFERKQFLSNGAFRTAPFAARAMAATGIMVVQVGGNDLHLSTAKEAPDNVAVYQSIVNTLADAGLADPKRVGAIGFSRTGYHIFYAMTTSPSLLAAASVTDVSTGGYFEYLFSADRQPVNNTWEKIYGASPFTEEGLKNWRASSPEFNMDKAKAPLLLVQPGALAVLFDLGPYAVLRYLHKPVDLIMLPGDTHVMTSPRRKFDCETFNVDWFRFWLKDEEDPDPAKAEQYTRWRALRKMQAENEKKLTPPPASPN